MATGTWKRPIVARKINFSSQYSPNNVRLEIDESGRVAHIDIEGLKTIAPQDTTILLSDVSSIIPSTFLSRADITTYDGVHLRFSMYGNRLMLYNYGSSEYNQSNINISVCMVNRAG